MGHGFFKTSSLVSADRLPSRLSNTTWDRLYKVAHPIWELEGGSRLSVRVKSGQEELDEDEETEETGEDSGEDGEPEEGDEDKVEDEVQHDMPLGDDVEDTIVDMLQSGPFADLLPPDAVSDIEDALSEQDIKPGDMVIMVLGGHRVNARVLDINPDSTLSLVSDHGYHNNVPRMFIAQAEPPRPQQPINRAITREDVPAQTGQPPSGQQPAQQASWQAQDIEKLVKSRGKAVLRLAPSILLEVSETPNGIKGVMYNTTTKPVSSQMFPDYESMVRFHSIRDFSVHNPQSQT